MSGLTIGVDDEGFYLQDDGQFTFGNQDNYIQ